MTLRKIVIIFIGIMVLVGSFVASGILSGMKEPPEKEEPPEVKKFVKTTPVIYGDIQTSITTFGRVNTAESLDLIAEVSGRMSSGSKPLKEGQAFRKGQLLFTIDDTEARLNLQAQKSDFLRDLAAILPDLKIDFTGNYEVWEAYFQSINLEENLPDLPRYASNKEKTFLATKNIFSNYYNIKSSEANLKKYRYYAPFSGSISTVSLQSGSFVNPGNVIARVLRSNRLELKVSVDVKDIEWVIKGVPVKIASEGGNQWEGVIIRIGDYVNPDTQSIDVFIAIAPGQNPLYDGQYLTAEIPARKIQDGMLIPRNALFNQNEVYVLEDTILKVKQVNVLRYTDESAIFKGLVEGEDLVIEPLINAHNNMKAFKASEAQRNIDLEKKDAKTQFVKN